MLEISQEAGVQRLRTANTHKLEPRGGRESSINRNGISKKYPTSGAILTITKEY
jgi:hypothetical protein